MAVLNEGNLVTTSDLIFIIGRQRSGTTVFRDLLARHGAVNCDEIFHGELTRPHRFYAYVLARVANDPSLVHPQAHARLFRDYIAAERAAADGRKMAMDVKYFGLNLIPQIEDVDNRVPYVIDFMRQNEANVVHIIRRNKLRVYVSEELSRATGRWSAERPEHVLTEKPKLTIDVTEALRFIDRLVLQDGRVGDLLDSVPMVERLYYHDMFDDAGLFSGKVQQVAARFMDLDTVDPKPGNLKMNPETLPSLVANYTELEMALTGTPHEWMLTDDH